MKTALYRLVLACIMALAAIPVSLPAFASQATVARSASPAKASEALPVTNPFAIQNDKQVGLVAQAALPSGRSTYGIPSRRINAPLPDTGIDRMRPDTPPPIQLEVPPLAQASVLRL